MATVAKRKKDSGKIDFSDWNLDTVETVAKRFVAKYLQEGAELASAEYDCDVYFRLEDAELIISLPLGDEDNAPQWTVPFQKLIDGEIGVYDDGFSPEQIQEAIENLSKLRDILQSGADKVTAAINAHKIKDTSK